MPTLDDPRWKDLRGGYRIPYDASVPLRRLEQGEDAWKELWEDLHHLVRIAATWRRRDWHFYGLVSLIEIERHRKRNPPLPSWLVDEYEAAWPEVLRLALGDLTTVEDADSLCSILGAVALARGQLEIGTWITDVDAATIAEDLETRRGWSELFR
jgi:hypothetical protein